MEKYIPSHSFTTERNDEMTVGKAFVAMLIAFFWMIFAWFLVFALNNPLIFQNNLKLGLFVSITIFMFFLFLMGTILMIRLVKNKPGFWTQY